MKILEKKMGLNLVVFNDPFISETDYIKKITENKDIILDAILNGGKIELLDQIETKEGTGSLSAENYFFWDRVHLSAVVHDAIYRYIAKKIGLVHEYKYFD